MVKIFGSLKGRRLTLYRRLEKESIDRFSIFLFKSKEKKNTGIPFSDGMCVDLSY